MSIPKEQLAALTNASPTADDILSNLDSFNEEIEETNATNSLPEVELPSPVRTKPVARRAPGGSPKEAPIPRSKSKIAEAAKKQETVEPSDLDSELNAFDSELDSQISQQLEEAVSPGESMREQILDLLSSTPEAPGELQINKWKAQLGDNAVHVMALGEGDVYIFTHLKRGQWKKIQELMTKAQQTGSTDMEDQLKEKVCQHCILWPRPLSVEFFYNSRAGVVDSLYQVILLNSYFLSPQQAMMLTTQL